MNLNFLKKSTQCAALCVALSASFNTSAQEGNSAGNADKAKAAAAIAESKSKSYKFDFKVPVYTNQEEVKSVADVGMQRSKTELERMVKDYESRNPNRLPSQDADGNSNDPKRPPVEGRLVVALSSSMPKAMLASYMSQLDGKREAIVVFRGFVGGARTVGRTVGVIEEARRKGADMRSAHKVVETVVDPLVFRSLGIDKVPAVAWLSGVQEIKHCEQETFASAVVAYGATSVESAIDEINKNGGGIPAAVVAKFRSKGWEQSAPSK